VRKTNPPAQFLSTPVAYVPDGSGRRCTQAAAGQRAYSARWPSGAALMPDKTRILIPYSVVCIVNASKYTAQGWGFAIFNWKTGRFSVPPVDVFPAQPSGERLGSMQGFGSPIVVDNEVTFYSWACCDSAGAIYATTLDARTAALKDPASYVPRPIAGLAQTYLLHVAPPSSTHELFTMYALRGKRGEYALYGASTPNGPWSQVGSGVLPRCDTSPYPCHSMALHPELGPPGELVVSYHLSGFGPGVATRHPWPREPLRHVVSASVPCAC
jgi:hypothetical protein